jgi:Zn ribbon nucleic-acid-binding protein
MCCRVHEKGSCKEGSIGKGRAYKAESEVMQGRLILMGPQCPKCKSYMFMPRIIDDVYYHKCKDCGYIKRQGKIDWKKVILHYLERFMFWKS